MPPYCSYAGLDKHCWADLFCEPTDSLLDAVRSVEEMWAPWVSGREDD